MQQAPDCSQSGACFVRPSSARSGLKWFGGSSVSPPTGGEIKSYPVFPGDMCLEKTRCSGEMGRQFRRNRALFPLHPSQKSPWTFSRRLSASSLSRFACSQRLASLRFGTAMAGYARLMPIPHFAPSSLLTTAQRFFIVTLRSPPQRLGRCRSHRVSPPAGGEIKCKACVFRGHAPRKTRCSGEMGRQFRRNRALFPAPPSQKSLDFCEKAQRFFAACNVFRISIARVIGPTPPGTGVR